MSDLNNALSTKKSQKKSFRWNYLDSVERKNKQRWKQNSSTKTHIETSFWVT